MCEDGLPPGTSSSDYGFWRHNIHSHAREIIMTTRRDRNFAFVSIDQNLDREKRFLTLLFEIVLIRIYIYMFLRIMILFLRIREHFKNKYFDTNFYLIGPPFEITNIKLIIYK